MILLLDNITVRRLDAYHYIIPRIQTPNSDVIEQMLNQNLGYIIS
jgi:hypothetical protein